MAFYTPPSLPHSPPPFLPTTMNATLPPIKDQSFTTWSQSQCKSYKHDTPITPPMTSTFHERITPLQPQPRVRMRLPPIAQLDRHLSAIPPLTPPDELEAAPPMYSPRLPPIADSLPEAERVESDDVFQVKNKSDVVDWLDFTRSRSARHIAEKTCEMICYLWFASSPPAEESYPSPTNSPPFLPRLSAHTTSLQLTASPTFVQFMQKLLETTQVSQSVIVLSLHYIYRLKDRNRTTPAQSGSEFRIAVAALMMANKYLDDNTYTNKTWSEVSGIDLSEIAKMEREFLVGVDNSLYVDQSTYESWLHLLKGLVAAKDKDSQRFRKSRQVRVPKSSSSTRTYSNKHRVPSHRARSTSPVQSVRTTSLDTTSQVQHAQMYAYSHPSHESASADPYWSSPTPHSGSKRTAATAFSPTSASFPEPPLKRPIAICLAIPESTPGFCAPNSSSPVEGLQSFAKMTLTTSPHSVSTPSRLQELSYRAVSSPWSPSGTRAPAQVAPETLVTTYALCEMKRASVPQNLYFYALACSPVEEECRAKKGRLRYHQPPPPSVAAYANHEKYIQVLPPMVQSATTSPHDVHMHVTPPTLPHFHETMWHRPPPSAPLPPVASGPPPSYQSEEVYSPIQAAPFANAGPPGIHFYPTPLQRSSSVYPAQQYQPQQTWSRARQF